ncbi:MAG: PaaI family thioesterase [Alphaproteobacteria bacterium]|nr:PaaI family thioesterase [Alphaproteobacteria bacterium]
MSTGRELFPVTQETVAPAHDLIFAPWVKQLALCDFTVDGHRVTARLPEADALKFSAGAVCGQAIMAAIDTVTALAMATGDRATRGTSYQHTHFLRPAKGDDFIVEANVLRFGKTSAYAETKVTFATSGVIVAHAVLEFAF